jgi:NADH-quinone oxidoreductase subunit J
LQNLTLSQYGFYILSMLTVFSALMVVLSRKPVHSVLYLIFSFFTIAGHYILLNAQFLAAVHIIVYAGAIMVLFLFTIMFLNLNAEVEPHKSNLLKITAVVAGGLLLIVFAGTLKGADFTQPVAGSSQIGMVKDLGKVLYTQYMLPFEIAAVLFLTAMVGVVMLGKKDLR